MSTKTKKDDKNRKTVSKKKLKKFQQETQALVNQLENNPTLQQLQNIKSALLIKSKYYQYLECFLKQRGHLAIMFVLSNRIIPLNKYKSPDYLSKLVSTINLIMKSQIGTKSILRINGSLMTLMKAFSPTHPKINLMIIQSLAYATLIRKGTQLVYEAFKYYSQVNKTEIFLPVLNIIRANRTKSRLISACFLILNKVMNLFPIQERCNLRSKPIFSELRKQRKMIHKTDYPYLKKQLKHFDYQIKEEIKFMKSNHQINGCVDFSDSSSIMSTLISQTRLVDTKRSISKVMQFLIFFLYKSKFSNLEIFDVLNDFFRVAIRISQSGKKIPFSDTVIYGIHKNLFENAVSIARKLQINSIYNQNQVLELEEKIEIMNPDILEKIRIIEKTNLRKLYKINSQRNELKHQIKYEEQMFLNEIHKLKFNVSEVFITDLIKKLTPVIDSKINKTNTTIQTKFRKKFLREMSVTYDHSMKLINNKKLNLMHQEKEIYDKIDILLKNIQELKESIYEELKNKGIDVSLILNQNKGNNISKNEIKSKNLKNNLIGEGNLEIKNNKIEVGGGNGNIPPPPNMGSVGVSKGNIPPPPNMGGNGNIPPPPNMGSKGNIPPPPNMGSKGNIPPPPNMSGGNGNIPPPPNMSGGGLPPPPNFKKGGGGLPPPPNFSNKNKINSNLNSGKKNVKAEVNLKVLHWIKVPDQKRRKTIWRGINDEKIKINKKDFFSLFSSKTNKKKPEKKDETKEKPVKKKQIIKLVDPKKSSNLELILKTFSISHQQIQNAILSLDEKVLTETQLINIKKYLPDKNDILKLQTFEGDKNLLGPCEKFYLSLIPINRLPERIETFLFKHSFKEIITETEMVLKQYLKALTIIENNKNFEKFLEFVLKFGNYLNGGTNKGGISGFKLRSLLKLKDLRSQADQKITLLHYIVMYLDKKNKKVLSFCKQFEICFTLNKSPLESIKANVNQIQRGVNQIKKELQFHKSPLNKFDRYYQDMKPFFEETQAKSLKINNMLQKFEDNFIICIKNFGENENTTAENFFDLISKIITNINTAIVDNEKRIQESIKKENKKKKIPIIKSKKPKFKPISTSSQNKNTSNFIKLKKVTSGSKKKYIKDSQNNKIFDFKSNLKKTKYGNQIYNSDDKDKKGGENKNKNKNKDKDKNENKNKNVNKNKNENKNRNKNKNKNKDIPKKPKLPSKKSKPNFIKMGNVKKVVSNKKNTNTKLPLPVSAKPSSFRKRRK
ncbi:protein diaphanous [Anaeramoeba flamelloides]|uniref:Protein diaphanous n=1 Tax=Anaeramoeba flamelloides TaxID=1746091 RepID=A0ABQ8ZF35_9EUKA|nr:protein diaphanous [Anaeramoeba flamelloides]